MRLASFLVCGLLGLGAAFPCVTQQRSTAITHVTVVDVETGVARPDQTVVMRMPPMTSEATAAARFLIGKRRALVGELYRAGIPILTGSDAPTPGTFPGVSLHEELVELVEACSTRTRWSTSGTPGGSPACGSTAGPSGPTSGAGP